MDVHVDRLKVRIEASPENRGRAGTIGGEAARLFASRLATQLRDADARPAMRLETLAALPQSIDLQRVTDTDAADIVAGLWLCAVADRLRL